MNNELVKLLYRSFDAPLTEREQARLDQALAASEELRHEKETIAQLRDQISENSTSSFKPFFAEKVLQRVTSVEDRQQADEQFWNSLVAVFRPVAVAAAIMLISMMSYNILKSDSLSLKSALAEPEITFDQVFDPVISFYWE